MKTEDITPEFDDLILAPGADESVCPVRTVPLNEFRFHAFCKARGLVSYLPLKKVWKVNEYLANGKRPYRSSRTVLRPMFPSYVFVKATKEQQTFLWTSRTVTKILSPASQNGFLDDIRAVRAFELTGLQQEVEFNAGLAEGDRFVIESGVWEGVTGWLKRKDRRFLWTVELEFNSQFVSTEIDPSRYRMRSLSE